jgi:TRAP-type C4-dicarboxylate transport system permease small subunit
MNTNGNTTKRMDTKVLLSTLWIIVMINILTADVLSLNIPGSEELLKTTSVSTGLSIPQLMLVGAIMNELSIVMIILSRVLKRGVNRWVNIIMGVVTIAYIWAGSAPYPHYTFIAAVETLCLLLIIWNAWKWTGSEE